MSNSSRIHNDFMIVMCGKKHMSVHSNLKKLSKKRVPMLLTNFNERIYVGNTLAMF